MTMMTNGEQKEIEALTERVAALEELIGLREDSAKSETPEDAPEQAEGSQ